MTSVHKLTNFVKSTLARVLLKQIAGRPVWWIMAFY